MTTARLEQNCVVGGASPVDVPFGNIGVTCLCVKQGRRECNDPRLMKACDLETIFTQQGMGGTCETYAICPMQYYATRAPV